MEEGLYDINNVQVQLMMVIQLQALQQQGVKALTYQNLEDYLSQELWKKKSPHSLHMAADDVMSIEPSAMVRFLSKKAIQDSRKENLSEFSDVIGGRNTHE
ncbi:MAG: hypothetical protein EOM64_03795 [Erysipelotrichia bacterium]|nr:hypothetical protein [Erysipelotrichia bacterium]